MKPGDIVEYSDEGIAIVLGPCQVPAPVPEESLSKFLDDPDKWPEVDGWAIKHIESGKIYQVQKQLLVQTDA